jgi:hypothetical protein
MPTARLALMALMTVALAGCGLLPINTGDTGFRIINRRDVTITFTVEDNAVHTTDGSQAVGPESVPPHQETFVPTSGCRGTGARHRRERQRDRPPGHAAVQV